MIDTKAMHRALAFMPTPAELEAHTALAGLAAVWKERAARRRADVWRIGHAQLLPSVRRP